MNENKVAYFITGGAGFIGSNLADRLLSLGHSVTVYDNFSTGMHEFIADASRYSTFRCIEGDLLDMATLRQAMAGHNFVFHLAANADVRFGTLRPRRDLEQNTIATFNVLEAMREENIRKIAFASTGSVYGEAPVFPTPETAPFPIQTSLYGASKVACEGLISAYCEGFGFQAWVYRFVSVLGERYSHGHLFDFFQKLQKRPDVLEVLGDGTQRKSYMYVQDCIDGMLLGIEKARDQFNVLNLGFPDYIDVNFSLATMQKHLRLEPKIQYTGGSRGWIGDNPFIFLDVSKIQKLGWQPKVSIRDAICKTLDWLQQNSWIYEKRK
jgi:UDP-glucose 4-epimerase